MINTFSVSIAHEAGRFKSELTTIEIKSKKAVEAFTTDEHPRPKSTIEGLAKLPPIFLKDGTVTAGYFIRLGRDGRRRDVEVLITLGMHQEWEMEPAH